MENTEINRTGLSAWLNQLQEVIVCWLADLLKSIEQQGVLAPITVRGRSEGGYEIISGHRRCFAAKEAGLTSVPGIVKECSDDDAVIMMVDSNIQKEGTLISEKAFAYLLELHFF